MTPHGGLLEWCVRQGREYRLTAAGGQLPTLSVDWQKRGRIEPYGRSFGFIANVAGATVFGPGFVKTPQGEIFCRQFSHRQYAPHADLLENWTEDEPTTVNGPAVYIGGWGNWGHWLFQYLTKLAAIPDELYGAQLIVPTDLPTTFYACLEKMGFYNYVRVDGPVTGDGLWTVTPGAYRAGNYQPHIWPEAVHFVRDRLVGRADLRKRTRLYISRAGARWRRIINEPALIDTLQRRGFMAVQLEKLALVEQLDLLGRVEMIVTPFGAGSTSVMLAPSDCRVLTFGPSQMSGEMGAKLYSDILGQPFYRLHCQASSADADYYAPLDDIEGLLGGLA
jgi:hypothetical protein